MKTLQKIILSLFVLSTLFSSQTVTFAVTKENISNFTPDRQTIQYTPGMPGLPYSSFNNIGNNPNIPGAWENDERKFLVGGLCKGGTCPSGGATYYNTLGESVKEGDVLRLAVYFHNNGEDPYVTTSYPKSKDAENVKIGVKLSDITDPVDKDWIRPLGFISATNNEYRTNKNDPNSALKENGQVVREATDDMQVLLSNYNLSLEPIAGSIWLTNKNANFNDYIKGETNVQFVSDKYDTKDYPPAKNLVNVKVTPHYEQDQMYITFDKLPGCFRYSGFVYFDVKVVAKEQPKCSSLKITKTDINDPLLSPQTASAISATYTFAPTNVSPDTTEILWKSTDKTGKFWKKVYMAAKDKYKYMDVTEAGNTAHSSIDEEIYYTGFGTVTAELSGIDATLANKAVCTDKFELVKPQKCQTLQVNAPVTITEGIISDLMAAATNEDGTSFTGQIKYWVDQAINGKFYVSPPSEYPYLNQPYSIKFGYTEAIQSAAKKFGQTGTQETTIAQNLWTHFVGLKAGTKVHIQAYDNTGKIDVSKCQQDLVIAAASKCKELMLNKDSVITEDQLATFSAFGRDTNGKTYNGKITYSVPPEYGTFYTDPNDPAVKNAKANTSQKSKQYDDTAITVDSFTNDLSKPVDGEFCSNAAEQAKDYLPKIIKNPNLIPAAIDVGLSVMYGEIPAYSMTQLIQQSLILNSVTDPTKLDMTQTNPSTNKFGTNNVFNALDQNTIDQSLISPTTIQALKNINVSGPTQDQLSDKTITDLPSPLTTVDTSTQVLFPYTTTFDAKLGQVFGYTKPTDVITGKLPKTAYNKLTLAQSGSTITVEPGTKVYFVPKKGSDGKKVISIYENCTFEGGCSQQFEIVPVPKEKPIICEAAGVTVTDTKTNQKVSCLKKGEYFISAGFYTDKNPGTPVAAPANTSVKWESTDPNGVFTDMTPNSKILPGKSPFVASLSVKYVGEGKITATLVALSGKPYTQKSCSAFIAPCTKNCTSLLFNIDGQTVPQGSPGITTDKNKSIKLSLSTKDTQEDPLPQSTKYNVIWNTNGTITDSKGHKNATPGQFSTSGNNLPLTFSGAEKLGQITATLDPTDPMYSAQCKADLSVLIPIPEEPLTCKNLNPNFTKYLGSSEETSLTPNEIYTVKPNTTYSKTSTEKNTVSVDPKAGTVVVMSNDPLINAALSTLLNNLKSANTLTKAKLDELKFTTLPSQTVANDETVYFVTYSDVSISLTNALRVKAENFFNKECDKSFALNYIPPTPKTGTVCEDLNIKNPTSPWIADGSKELFEIDVTTTPKNEEKNLKYVWKVTDSKGNEEWSNGQEEETTTGSLKNTLRDAESGTAVEVYALDKDGNKVANCSDTIKAKTNESPVMTKSVYMTATSPVNTTKDLLNIGSTTKNKNVTYKVQFKANSAKETDIWESAMKNSGQILGDKDGNLSYLGMIVNVTEGSDKYTVLRDGNYTSESADSKFTDYKYTLKSLQEKHNCKDGTQNDSKVCLDETDFANAVETFKDAGKLTFKNLKSDTVIEIKVQMKNNTKVTAESCKTYSKTEGCGEQFKNTAKFDATMSSGNNEKGSATAKVIVICPYVLTRQAGDVFFHDVLDTGIDVSRCSEVKSTPGLVIQPEKQKTQKNVSTGAGDLPTETAFLDVPSHDICRYSNDKKNVQGYNDILTNFSSTICEMRADVAQTWKESYINASINANVERISRFGENLNVPQISTMQDLQNLSNVQSGVFVKKGDLTVGGNGDFTIEANGKVPAGQTYIVKGGTLHIKSNVKYGATDYTDPNKIPSAAFIVIDGNIVIDNNVGQIDAIVMAIDTDGSGDGKISNGGQESTDNLLVINGSLIGNVAELFSSRTGSGDPTKDEGSVTIRYDERILLNTPPGLSDILNVTQSLIPG